MGRREHVAQSCSILVVEDDPTIRLTISELLRDEGHTVIEASDGANAVAVLRARRPPPATLCLVLLDMMLPIIDGVQVLQVLATLGSYVPVVAMSADHVQLLQAVRAGAEATLGKPFDLDRLLDVVERNCSH